MKLFARGLVGKLAIDLIGEVSVKDYRKLLEEKINLNTTQTIEIYFGEQLLVDDDMLIVSESDDRINYINLSAQREKRVLDDSNQDLFYKVIERNQDQAIDILEVNEVEEELEPAIMEQQSLTNHQGNSTIAVMNYKSAFKQAILDVYPFTLSRVFVALNSIGNGIVLAKLGADAVASGPIIATTQAVIIGTARGGFFPVGILIGIANGKEAFHEIGGILNQGWILASTLSIPVVALFAYSKSILTLSGISEPVAQASEDYLFSYGLGVPAIFFMACDQQFTLGIKKRNITLLNGAIYPALTMLIGFPLALGAFGIPEMGNKGLGYGSTISAWITFAGFRLFYFLNADFKTYNLFSLPHRETFAKMKDFLKLSGPMAMQTASEWGNLFALSLIVGGLGEEELICSQPSLQLTLSYNIMLFGIVQATSVLISNQLGKIAKAYAENQIHDIQIHKLNTKRLGNSCVLIGLGTSAVMAALYVGIPKQLTEIFVGAANINEDVLVMSQAYLLINGIGLLFDSIRNVYSGKLSGLKDAMFAPLVSFITMSLLGLTAGYATVSLLDWGADWLFITRDIGIILAAASIALRWFLTNGKTIDNACESQHVKTLIVNDGATNDPESTANIEGRIASYVNQSLFAQVEPNVKTPLVNSKRRLMS